MRKITKMFRKYFMYCLTNLRTLNPVYKSYRSLISSLSYLHAIMSRPDFTLIKYE